MRTRTSPRNQEILWRQLGGKRQPIRQERLREPGQLNPPAPGLDYSEDQDAFGGLVAAFHAAGYRGEGLTRVTLEACLVAAICFGTPESVAHFKARLADVNSKAVTA
jgi:hypothetical protein